MADRHFEMRYDFFFSKISGQSKQTPKTTLQKKVCQTLWLRDYIQSVLALRSLVMEGFWLTGSEQGRLQASMSQCRKDLAEIDYNLTKLICLM